VQFLKAISSSDDLGNKRKSKFALFVTGEADADQSKWISKPYGVTAYKGKIYVCDMGGWIVVIDPEKESLEVLDGSRLPGLAKPANLAFDKDGNFYISDMKQKSILVYGPNGRFQQAIGKAPDFKPSDLVVEGDFVYALNLDKHEIRKFDRRTGRHIGSIGGNLEAMLQFPVGLAVKDGVLFVTNMNGTVVKVDRDGNYVGSFGEMGDGYQGFVRPKGIAIDEEDRMYVGDNGMQIVKIFDKENRLLLPFGYPGLPQGSMNLPVGVMITKENVRFFQKFADPSFEVESLIFVTNQFGTSKLSVYGLGHRREKAN
jgi:DNA-binding beta-propeller fold protein YncE